ncbi:RING finger protein 150 [Halyomorpha halys]|uniref:RING finger protein 150 n=1 Tax=Halyomorpha halys TaxID=286706 RepID=UPI0006D50790|nr:RING finger protein 150 [Halyomorpha halys]XP_014291231.1 RING finger protein 150 [Halyomorpha halys]XP_014291232.1 RING finger protein 150 [Halyomorpha halys]XP_014291233.1 RING finger protein 150 [Halyomorpha halys]XP_014291234.1 RING finger protein 150 [Halyomorpha halys]
MATHQLLLLASLLGTGACTTARIQISSSSRTWTTNGIFEGGRSLPATGYIFYGGDYCQATAPSSERPLIVFATPDICSFDVKIRNAENDNASAIVFLFDREFSSYERAIKYLSDTTVSVIFVSQPQEEVLKLIDTSRIVGGYVTAMEISQPDSQSRKFLLVSAVISLVIFVVGGCYGAWYYHDQMEIMNDREKLQTSEECAIETTIEKIPSRALMDSSEKVIEDYNTCAVCFENYKLFEIISSLPCSHIFHKSCLHPWLTERRSCPLCKMDILKHYGLPAASSEESIINIPLDDVVSYLEGVPI